MKVSGARMAACVLGAGLLLAGVSGCGGDDVFTPQGAFLVTFNDSGSTCPVSGHNAAMGAISATRRTSVISDGEGGASVSCIVRGSSTFHVQALASVADKTLQVAIEELSPSATKEAPSYGRVGFTSPNSVNTYMTEAESPCVFYFANPSQGVAPGKLWVTFACPDITAQGGNICELRESYAIFENCEQ